MKISTKLKLAAYVPALMALIVIVALVFSYQEMARTQEAGDTVRQIRTGITELNHQVFSYILYHEERPRQQFLAAHDALTGLLDSAQVRNPEQQRLLDNIRANTVMMKDLFLQLVSLSEQAGTAVTEERLVGLLLLKSYEADSDAALLRRLVDDGIKTNEANTTGLVFLVMVLATIPLTIVLVRVRRGITSSLTNLGIGAYVIGSGNLDYKIEDRAKDEIGDVARAFNQMTAHLKTVIASKADLEREIEERERAQSELKSTAAQRQLALDAARMGWWQYDPVKRYSWWDERYKEIFGFAEYEKPNDEILTSRLHPEDLPGVWKKVEAALDPVNPQTYSAEYRINLPDGSMRWVEAHGLATFEGTGKDKHAISLVGTVADITERIKAEEAVRQTRDYLDNLFNYANAPIIVWNPAFEITRFNHAFERLTGRSAEEVIGKKLDILFPDDSRETSMGLIRKTALGERWEVVEIPILHRSGTVRVVLWNSATVYAPDGKTAIATIAQGQDITERKKAEEELKRINAELEASNKELEAFSYSVSHDLRAPLRSMEGFSSALLEDCGDKLDAQGRQYLGYIQDSSDLMGRLIDDLLKLSRVTRSDMNWETVNLSEMARKIIAELQNTDPAHKVKADIAPNITAYGDRNLLRLVLENLLGNAWKFSGKADSPRIEMDVAEHNGKPAYFVRDNGVGFDMNYADKLFKPFQRLHKATEFAGTGIGLATVQRIIRRHGGEVWAESKVGEGAAFYFTLG